MTPRRPDRLGLLNGQLELVQSFAALDPEQIADRRLALQAADKHGVNLVL